MTTKWAYRLPITFLAALFCTYAVIAQSDTSTETKQDQSRPITDDGQSYPVSSIVLNYVTQNPDHPPLDAVMAIEVELGQTSGGFVAAREGVPSITFRLSDLAQQSTTKYYASAIQSILETIRNYFSQQEILGVFVAPDPFEIDESGRDLRAAGQTSLRVLITTGIVTELRTLASGARIDAEERIDHPLHAGIRERSPIQPATEGDETVQNLLRKDKLDRFLFHLSRHPGRRVDASIAAARAPGGVALDYMITENKPWMVYAQVSNTGTKATERWREQFGYINTQLTDNDDVLEFSFTTAGFTDNNAIFASYEAPFFDNSRLRWRVYTLWSEFTATDVGFFDDDFTGESFELGGEFIANIYQDRELFLDLFGGARILFAEVSNPFVGEGQESFILPKVGLRLEKMTESNSTTGFVELEWQIGGFTDVQSAELTRLGRTLPDDDWAVFKWGLAHSFYLEPLLDREAWQDPTTPESSTLAHEIAMSIRGQYAFDKRLIPNLEQAVGGIYTVRGYPESIVAADTVIIGSLEYRYHVPRAFEIESEPRQLFGKAFRVAPQYVYGHPDWDLVLKAFLDVGQTVISDPLPFESDETLIGVGIGLEAVYRRNLRLRLDWGFALQDIDSRDVNSGSNRLHVVASILF
ncbi:MAG: ShlB/FhaC/HecB family hemolysin secretion/activation protein [Planctomycetes bacterium]|nr:ShlB/FhaC/HecB family hemolysin secretion/activation protein [Planctomycetota bacterium]